MRTIEIVVQPDGQTKVETKGFTGPECRQASEFIETALGQPSGEHLTAEYYQGIETQEQVNRQQH